MPLIKQKKWFWLKSVTFTSFIIFHCSAFSFVDPDRTDNETDQVLMNGEITVQLSNEQSKLAHFKLATLKITRYQAYQAIIGKVLNIQGLIERRSEFLNVAINLSNAIQQEQIAYHAYQRATQLAAEGISSITKTNNLKKQWLTLRTSSQALKTHQSFLKKSTQQQWGKVLANAIIENKSIFSKLESGQSNLLLITVPPPSTQLDLTKAIEVSSDGLGHNKFPAELISISPISQNFAGKSYFLITETETLSTGARVTAWIPKHDIGAEGVMIPESAIVWHNTRPWVYVQLDNHLYARRSIPKHHQVDKNWFVPGQFSSGDRIVITGSSVLLSEELRSEIPEEDDD